MQTVAVIDYGMGNLHSVAKALEHVGAGRVLITSDAQVIREADRVVFPGVGAIRDCMAEIRRLGFDALVREVSADRPFLGICVGMQALLERSEENDGVDCIGLFPGQVRFFGKDLVEDGEHLKVPHMGWNEVKQVVDHLKSKARTEHLHHTRVYRPWGHYEGIDAGDRFQVKRITVKPGATLSLQMHHHRAEHWIVVSGTAKVTCDDNEFLLTENQSCYIPMTSVHRLANPGKIPLEIIEVQSGSYLGEDDIVRYQDTYGRN